MLGKEWKQVVGADLVPSCQLDHGDDDISRKEVYCPDIVEANDQPTLVIVSEDRAILWGQYMKAMDLSGFLKTEYIRRYVC